LSLADRFHKHVNFEIRRLQGRYNPTEFRRMVEQYGAVDAAKRLLADPRHTSYGFERLWELSALDASIEFAACLPWFRELSHWTRLTRLNWSTMRATASEGTRGPAASVHDGH
jgi:hypothetical protein